MLAESDAQVLEYTNGRLATHAIVPIGVGSIAEAVTRHYKNSARPVPGTIITVEPTTAACFQTSMRLGELTTIETGDSIMCGMNCGTLSTTAWPILKDGVSVSVTVTDLESHKAVQELNELGVQAGPCGAATLAALRKTMSALEFKGNAHLQQDSVIVLYCTEGSREYQVPHDKE
jgi:diaminopropionate ammonia-lyase